MTDVLKETQLYPPLKFWLEHQGYTVRGEVGHCDLVAVKNGYVIAIELKLRPSLILLAQAVERQEYTDSVYVALPVTSNRPRPPSFRKFRRLLTRLGIGLILITFTQKKTKVSILIHPESNKPLPRQRPRKRTAILREIAGRDLDMTPGGLAGGTPRVSAYRHRAIRLAVWLSVLGEASPAQLRKLGALDDTGTILSKNLYGWFERVQRGVYRLHHAGESALKNVPELEALYKKELAPDFSNNAR